MTFLQFVFQDFPRNKANTKGKIVLFFFRIANYTSDKKVIKIIFWPYLFFYKFLFELILGFEFPFNIKVDKGLIIFHLQAVVVNENTVIGSNFTLRQCTTIGNKGSGGNCPVIGNNVNVGANVCIIGDIIIGDNVIIGAGSIVVKNVPSNSTVVGNPARIIKENNIDQNFI